MAKISPRNCKPQAGFSLLEMMVAIGITGLILASVLTSASIMNSMKAQQRVSMTKNEIANRIRTLALTPGSLENSAIITFNLGTDGLLPAVGAPITFSRYDRLLKCHPAFTKPEQTGCDRSSMDDAQRGNYVYISDRNSLDPNTTVAGEYVYYSLDGARCTQAQAQSAAMCPIYARAWAEPYCLNFAAVCNKAMSVAVRYSVGVRSDYGNAQMINASALEGEVIAPLQKGIQITRLLDQDNNPLVANAKGIYGVEKYYGYPDQSGNPRALRFEVMVGNPTGLKHIRMQMRALTGSDVVGLTDMGVPEALNAVPWTDVPNPDNATQPWIITLANASQNQLFNFGTINTIKGFIIGAQYNLPNNNVSKQNYLYYLDPSGTTLLPPKLFKSGMYQFRVIATDITETEVESTNYASVRIFSRPQMYLSAATPIPPSIWRNCIDKNLKLTILTADDETLVSSSYTITDAAGAVTASGSASYAGNTGSFDIELDKSLAAGVFNINHKTFNKNSNLVVRGFPLPETTVSTMPAALTLSEVIPIVDLISAPMKVRMGSSAIATYSYTTGNCCTQAPTLNWTFPSVPEAGGVPMLASSDAVTKPTCALNAATGTRTCTATATIEGTAEGPPVAAPDISVDLQLPLPVAPACKVTTTAAVDYFQVIKIPGIQFANTESLWVDAPAGAVGSIRPMDRKVRIKADFPPADEAVSVDVKTTAGVALCSGLTFAPGTTVDPVYQECDIPAAYNGDLILSRASANIKTAADPVNPSWQASLVAGRLQHRVCNADLGTAGGPFPLTYVVPTSLPMLNSPWGLDPSGAQKPTNDAGQWGPGTLHTLKCWDNWAEFASATNLQDNFYTIDKYNDGKVFNAQKNTLLSATFPTFFFPYNGGASPDFKARNVPYIFTITRGPPKPMTYEYTKAGEASASVAENNPWTDVTTNYCNGGTSLSQLTLYTNQLMGFDTATQTMKAVNSMHLNPQAGTHYSYTFICTYGNYKPTGE